MVSDLDTVKHKSVVQKVIDDLILQIKKGELKPGDKIPSQRTLAKDFKIGRSCVREALQALSLANIISIQPGKGAFVSELSLQSIINPAKVRLSVKKGDLLDLINVRLILETAAIKEAVRKATPSDIEKLHSHLKNSKTYLKENKIDLYYYEDYEFHKTLFSCTKNKILISIFNFIFEMFMGGIKETGKVPGSTIRGMKWHNKIYYTIKNRDVQGAEEALRNHILQVKEDIHKADELVKLVKQN